MNRNFPLILITLLLLTLPSAAFTQTSQSVAASTLAPNPTRAASAQDIRSALAILPEADTLIFLNPQRILNEAAPRLMSEKDLAGMRKAFADVKQFSGVDPTRVEFIVIAVRFRKPTADLRFSPPEFMAVAGGDLSSESLINLARMASEGKLRDEPYASKTISLMTIEPLAKEAEKNPFLKSFSEVGVVPLTGNMIAVGTPGYLRSAVDAADGNGRISTENLNSLLRDPSVLASAAGSPWDSFAKSFGLLGTEVTPRAPRFDSNLGDFYVALTMDATNFMLRGAMGADNPDTANIINNLIAGFMRQAASYVPDKSGTSPLEMLKFTAKDNEVVLTADVPQQMLLEFIKSQTQSKKDEAAASSPTAKPPARKPLVRRKRRKP